MRRLRYPLILAALVLAIYGAWIVSQLRSGRSALDFVCIGEHFLHKERPLASRSAVLERMTRGYRTRSRFGYDGQFYYFMAIDPRRGPLHCDAPSYRYGRMLLPLLARAAALGDVRRVAPAILTINWLSIGALTFFLGATLQRRRLSPLFALFVGFYDGMFESLQRDLTEPLSCAIAAAALYVRSGSHPRRRMVVMILFGLAGLARETTLLFPLTIGVVELGSLLAKHGLRVPWRKALVTSAYTAGAAAPFVAWKIFLRLWMGDSSFNSQSFQFIPFQGIASYWPWDAEHVHEVVVVVVPAVLCLIAAIWIASRAPWRAGPWLLLAHALVFEVFLARDSHCEMMAITRHAAAIPVAAIIAAGDSTGRFRRWAPWLIACGALWLSRVPETLIAPTLHILRK